MKLLDILNAIAAKSKIANDWNSVDLKNQTVKNKLTEFFGNLENDVPISTVSEESEKQITELTSEIQTLADEASFNRYNTDKCQQLVNLILRRKPSSDKSPLNSVSAISWGPGDLIAYGTTQGILGFYNSKDNTYEEYAKYTDSAITAIKWKENLVVFGNKSGVVRVWDNREKLIVKELGVSYPIRALCLMADNFLAVATTKTYSSVNISNVEYRRTKILDISSLACFKLKVAAGAVDGNVYIFDEESKNENSKVDLQGHTQKVTSVCWSSDGTKVASGSEDKTVRIWNLDGEQLQILKHNSSVRSVAWSPDNGYIASADGSYLYGWDVKDYQLWFKSDRNVLSLMFNPNPPTVDGEKNHRLVLVLNERSIAFYPANPQPS